MKRIGILLFVVCAVVMNISAQKVSIKSVRHLDTDTWGLRNNRVDSNGKNCAVIRVGVVGVKDMAFSDAVGSVERSGSEYIVYVPETVKTLKYSYNDGKITGAIDFSKYPEVSPLVQGHSYAVVFETENHIRAAVFSVTTQTLTGDVIPVQAANLTFDGVKVPLDKDGMAIIEKPIGNYKYSILANGYESQSGTVKLIEDDISTTTDIALEAKSYPFAITCTPPNASLFIDDVAQGQLDQISDLTITEGNHNIRLVAVGYDDYIQPLDAKGDVNLNINMLQKKQEVVKFTDERTRTRVNVRPGYYLTLGGNYFDKEKYLAQQWGFNLSFAAMQHFGGIFAIREGIGYGISFLDKELMKEAYESVPKDTTTNYLEMPLQVGVSIPFGSYNKNLFSIMGGGYGKYMWTKVSQSSDGKTSKDEWDYGLRLSAILDIKHFTISADASTSLNGLGLYFGLNLGFKFY